MGTVPTSEHLEPGVVSVALREALPTSWEGLPRPSRAPLYIAWWKAPRAYLQQKTEHLCAFSRRAYSDTDICDTNLLYSFSLMSRHTPVS